MSSTDVRRITFRMVGGPHDGDSVPMPVTTVPTSKSLVLQDKKDRMGVLHRYYFNRRTRIAKYEGVVRVAQDEVG